MSIVFLAAHDRGVLSIVAPQVEHLILDSAAKRDGVKVERVRQQTHGRLATYFEFHADVGSAVAVSADVSLRHHVYPMHLVESRDVARIYALVKSDNFPYIGQGSKCRAIEAIRCREAIRPMRIANKDIPAVWLAPLSSSSPDRRVHVFIYSHALLHSYIVLDARPAHSSPSGCVLAAR